MDCFDSRALRRTLGVTWSKHITNLALRSNPTAPSITPCSNTSALAGHVLRLPEEHPTRTIMHFNPQQAGWKRWKGAPRTCWLDVIAQDPRACNVTLLLARHLARNRFGWRDLIVMVGSMRPVVQEDKWMNGKKMHIALRFNAHSTFSLRTDRKFLTEALVNALCCLMLVSNPAHYAYEVAPWGQIKCLIDWLIEIHISKV